jgi:hypothetical protein
VQKVGTKSLNIPGGRAESTLTILDYSFRKSSKQTLPNNEKIIIFGGVNDIKTLNELWIYSIKSNTWNQVENKADPFLPRKGHSAVIFYNDTDDNINPEIMRTYNLIIYGGKNDFGYINEILVVDIIYMVIEDKFFYKFRTIETNDLVEPDKREVLYMNLSF